MPRHEPRESLRAVVLSARAECCAFACYTRRMSLGVGVVGIGWCATQHIKAFQKNPQSRVVALCGRDEARVRQTLAKNGIAIDSSVRMTTRFEDLLASKDVDIISVATPNDLH